MHHLLTRQTLLLSCLLALTIAGGVAAEHIARSPHPVTTAIVASRGPIHLSGRLDRGSVLHGGDGLVKLELVLRADELPDAQSVRVPTDLIVVLDRSGSMQGAPLQEAAAAVRELIAGMDARDRFSLVTYSSGAEVAVPLEAASAEARGAWQRVLSSLQARGGTNMSGGLDLAASMAHGERAAGRALRVILLSDGHANQGDHSHAGLRTRASRAVAGEYVLSAVGIGPGFDEQLMSMIADAGTGNFYYVRGGEGLGGVFAGEFAAARETVASSLQVEIATAAGVEVIDAAGYPLERRRGAVAFRPGALFSGQERRVWLTLRAPTDAEGRVELGALRLDYQREGEARSIAYAGDLKVDCVASEEGFFADVDPEAWAESVMVDDYNALRIDVARLVKSGERDEALEKIRAYKEPKTAFNRRMKRKDVAEQLDTLDELSTQVRDAFVASPAEVNSLGKSLNAEGRNGRRVGAKK